MKRLKLIVRPIFEIGLLLITSVFALLWLYKDDPSYEPIIVIIGALAGCFVIFDKYKGKFFHSEKRIFTPSELIQHSEKLRVPLQEEIYRCRAENLREDVIIRHVKRHDQYPNNIDRKKKGISSWFKVGLMATYHQGIRVGLRYMELKECENGYRAINSETEEKGDVTALLIGEIPFSAIEAINMDGDEYYPYPHIFCYFSFKGQPYERLIFCEKVDMGHGHPYFKELAGYEEVRKNSKNIPNYYFR